LLQSLPLLLDVGVEGMANDLAECVVAYSFGMGILQTKEINGRAQAPGPREAGATSRDDSVLSFLPFFSLQLQHIRQEGDVVPRMQGKGERRVAALIPGELPFHARGERRATSMSFVLYPWMWSV
jgi:hypothetical protein